MNYRHGYHAGNFADLAKHASLLVLLRTLRDGDKPLRVVDTHAGAGAYDLSDANFARSREAEAGIKHLLGQDVPDSLKPLADYVRAKNAAEGFRDRIGVYPGSPILILDHLRAGDDYIGCELRGDDYALLRERIAPRGEAVQADGYAIAVESATDSDDRDLLFLIDPPFELPGDYTAIVTALSHVLDLRPDARALVWLPIKDLETLDAFLRHMERDLDGADIVSAEMRLRPLWNPMKMNGCALVAVNAPDGFAEMLEAIARDVVAVFGEAGGQARVSRL